MIVLKGISHMKLCLVASSGGHWEELMSVRDITNGHESFYVTEEGGQSEESGISRIYTLPQINRREKLFLIKFIKLTLSAVKIIACEKPDVVVTTGALISVPFCYVAKAARAKIVYIESFSRVKDKSLSGKLVYPIADLFLVQWESLLELYPKAKYIGGVF